MSDQIPALPKWDYNEAELLETKKFQGVTRHLYKLPDIVKIHDIDSPVYFYHYEPIDTKSKKSIFISYPILGGKLVHHNGGYKFEGGETAQVAAWYGTKILGMHSIVVVTDNTILFNPLYDPSNMRLELENVYLNHMQMQDFLKNSGWFEKMDWNDVHHFGISLGALTAITVAGLSKVYSTVTAVVGGAPLSDIFAYSQEQPVKDYFIGAMWNFDKTKQELMDWLERDLKIFDTHEAIQMIATERIYLVLALFDDAVPNNVLKPNEPRTGFKLQQFAHYPQTDMFPTNHPGIVAGAPVWIPRMTAHIKKWAKKGNRKVTY
jgi:hypothetical protein